MSLMCLNFDSIIEKHTFIKKTIFALFLFAGTTFGFANTANVSNNINKVINVNNKEFKIIAIDYSKDGQKCTVTVSYNNGNGSYGTITVTASTCTKAAMIITNMLAQGE